jgi:4-hydroxy-3-polyprenylbenzoate decarboxylase
MVALKSDPVRIIKNPGQIPSLLRSALHALPVKSNRSWRKFKKTTIGKLPQIVTWPEDGGAFITMPQVCTIDPDGQGVLKTNIGMYRIQLSGNEYIPDKEVGMHYQIHRGIGIHHQKYNQTDRPFKASIFIGGPPAHSFAAILPLPEELSEVTFAGMLAGRRFRYSTEDGWICSTDADFVITGTILKDVKKPEGPFGDHLGYYSLKHDFPVMKINNVYHRPQPIWHFTVVGRPPQEDSSFGHLIFQLIGDLIPNEFPGIKEVNPVDEAGVHPLLLAIGSERYMPFRERRPEEILTQANHLLGKGQTSLAKFLIIADQADDPSLTVRNIPNFFTHVLERIDLSRDLHFQTKTTIDTLDYSGTGWNAGSKLVIACCGDRVRSLNKEIPDSLKLTKSFSSPGMVAPGIVALKGVPFTSYQQAKDEFQELEKSIQPEPGLPLIVVCDDPEFLSESYANFLWATFTRSNPSHDIYGVGSFTDFKHWGCSGPLILDARLKPHHAPLLVPDPDVSRKVNRFFRKGASLEGWD